jgi:hypothetical protein
MRLAWVPIAVVAFVGSASAETPLATKYAGKIIISSDPPPRVDSELPAYVKTNIAADGRYELIKGPPWSMHLTGFVAKDPGGPVTLVFTDTANNEPIQAIEVAVKRRMVLAQTAATVAAGFEAGKTYLVTIVRGKAVLAKAELRLRP